MVASLLHCFMSFMTCIHLLENSGTNKKIYILDDVKISGVHSYIKISKITDPFTNASFLHNAHAEFFLGVVP